MVTIISVTLLLTGLGGMMGTVVWILRRGNNNPMTRDFVGCQLSVALWLISQLLILFSVTEKQLFISYFIGNAGICAFAPLWLMFSAEYSVAVPAEIDLVTAASSTEFSRRFRLPCLSSFP